MPGTLQLSGSPELDVLITRYCILSRAAIAHCMSCAVAARGRARNHTGNPVASARNPMYSAPNSPASSVLRRLSIIVGFLSQRPRDSVVGASQASANVERSAFVGVAFAATCAS